MKKQNIIVISVKIRDGIILYVKVAESL